MTILITGASGLVGSALVEELSRQNRGPVYKLTSSDCDLTDADSTKILFESIRPTYVYHLAARVYGLGGNQLYKSDVLVQNTLMNINVVQNSARVGVKKIVAMGSGCVYPDFSDGKPTSETQIWFGPPHASEDSYGHSKRHMLAHLLAAKQQHNLDFAFVVSGNLYGPRDNFNVVTGHVIPSLIAKFFEASRKGTNALVWGTGSAIRDFMYSTDAAQALVAIMDHQSGPINMGSGDMVEIRKVVEILQELTGVKVDWDKTKPDGQLARYYDLSLLQSLGHKSLISLYDGLARTYEWYAANYPRVRA